MSMFAVLPWYPRQIWENEWLSSSQTDQLSLGEGIIYFGGKRNLLWDFYTLHQGF